MDEDKKGFKAPGTGLIIAACAVVAVLMSWTAPRMFMTRR